MMTAVSWLFAVAALLFVGWPLFRARLGMEREPDSVPPLERQKLDAYAAIKEAEFDRRMGKLSDEHRECLHLVFYEGMSLADVAAVQNCPEGTVKTRLFHARQKIKNCLQALLRSEGGTPDARGALAS